MIHPPKQDESQISPQGNPFRFRFCVGRFIIATFGFDASLETAVSQSAERMIDWLCRRSTLSRSDAYRHLSLCADLRITQLVNGQKGAHCLLDRGSLAGIAGLH